MLGFGKKKVAENVVVESCILALLDDIEDAIPVIIEKLITIPGGNDLLPLPKNAKEIMAFPLFTLDLVSLRNLFKNDQAERLRCLSITCFANKLGLGINSVLSQIEEYESLFNESVIAGLNPIEWLSDLLYNKMWVKNSQAHHAPIQKTPHILLVAWLSLTLVHLSGRWKGLRDKFRIVKS
jgi:hypothetical protein